MIEAVEVEILTASSSDAVRMTRPDFSEKSARL
jgi:hypothetical protein